MNIGKLSRLIKIKLYRFAIINLLKLDNALYSLISSLSIRLESNNLHPKHRIMRYHDFFVDNVNKNDRVLDVGCGNGALSYDVAKKSKCVTGIDINVNNILTAKKLHNKDNIGYICADIKEFKPCDKYDVILLSNVLEHIDDRVNLLLFLKQYAPKFLIRVPMIDRNWVTLYKYELGVDYKLDPSHFIEYTFESFSKEIAGAGLKIESYEIKYGEIWSVIKA